MRQIVHVVEYFMTNIKAVFTGFHVKDEELQEAAVQSEVLTLNDDYLLAEFREECEQIIDLKELKAKDCKKAFMFLKENFTS